MQANIIKNAIQTVKNNPNKIVIIDSGEGWKAEVSYIPEMKKITFIAIDSKGIRII